MKIKRSPEIKKRQKLDRILWSIWSGRRARLAAVYGRRHEHPLEYVKCLTAFNESFAIMDSYLREHYSECAAHWRFMALAMGH